MSHRFGNVSLLAGYRNVPLIPWIRKPTIRAQHFESKIWVNQLLMSRRYEDKNRLECAITGGVGLG